MTGLAGRVLIVVVGAIATVAFAASASAQGVFILNGTVAPATDKDKTLSSFTLPTQTTDVKDALSEFTRFVEHEAWEKAFKALETISQKTSTGFIERADGVLLPSRLLVRSLLAGLPPTGKSAYRVFYDPQATELWESAKGSEELANLSKIVDTYLISTVGDRAADRLGDLYFERGELDSAIASWRAVVDYCPDTRLARPQLLVKIATALARTGRWNEFAELQATIADRFAGETVTVGGRSIEAGEYLAALAQRDKVTHTAGMVALPKDIELPSSDEPLWQFRFQTAKADPANPAQPFRLVDAYGRTRANDFPIASAADDERMYVNVFGVQMAFDLSTGKMLWRTGRLHELNFQQNRQGALPERYSISAAGDRVWCVTREPSRMNQQPPVFELVAREAATGKELLSSRRALSSWSIVGTPLITDDVIYVGGTKSSQSRELHLLLLNPKDCKLIKSVALGSHVVDPNQVYFERAAEPSFLLLRNRLYVDTHAGALISLEPESGAIEWGILYESPPPQTAYYYYNYVPPQFGLSGPTLAGGLLFAKGMRSPRLLGIEADGPSLAWNRPVDDGSVLAGADDTYIYMGGKELTAYDLKTKELIWSTQLPETAAWSVPLVTENRLYQFTSRGVYEVDKTTGRVLKLYRGSDLDGFGGSLFITPKALVAVSNLAITAYPLRAPAAEAGSP